MEYHDQFDYCPRCAAPYAPESRQTDPCVFVCGACRFELYHNPKPSISAVVPSSDRPDRVLVLERSTPPSLGAIALPGGILDYGEAPEDCLRREAREETGVTVVPAGIVSVHLVSYMYKGAHIWMYETAFACEPVSESSALGTTEEASRVWFEDVEVLLQQKHRFAFPEQYRVIEKFVKSSLMRVRHAVQL